MPYEYVIRNLSNLDLYGIEILAKNYSFMDSPSEDDEEAGQDRGKWDATDRQDYANKLRSILLKVHNEVS